jgi:translation initiation factor 1
MAMNLDFNPLGVNNWDSGKNLNGLPADSFQQQGYTQKIHVRVQQRNKKSYTTTLSDMDDDLDLKRICKAMARAFSCSGTVINDKEHGEIIQLTGDQRENIKAWLIDMEILTAKDAKERLMLHGA